MSQRRESVDSPSLRSLLSRVGLIDNDARLTLGAWIVAAIIVAIKAVDIGHRMLSGDLAAVAFAEGGDDAYYYFTVARNLAAGHGITVDGVHWTSGFHPLWLLICGMAFWLASDRGAFGLIYLADFALWLWSSVLFVRYVAIMAPMTRPWLPPVLAVAFLGEAQLSSAYFNGMDTGLYLTLCLVLLVLSERYLFSRPTASTGTAAAIGVLMGLVMLARNDGVFLCGVLIFSFIAVQRTWRSVVQGFAMIAAASALVLPWLIYCHWTAGYWMPQSGVATSLAIRGQFNALSYVSSIGASIVPIYFFKVQTAIAAYPAAVVSVFAMILSVCVVRLGRNRTFRMQNSALLTLYALMAACVVLLVYYPVESAATQFFTRYFSPLKIFCLIVFATILVRHCSSSMLGSRQLAIVGVLLVMPVLSQFYWTWRDFGQHYRSHMGYEAWQIVRSSYATDRSRIGVMESGRLGFLFPDRVVNLDGKMNSEALSALVQGRFVHYLREANLDYLMLRDYDVEFFDERMNGWRQLFEGQGVMGHMAVFKAIR